MTNQNWFSDLIRPRQTWCEVRWTISTLLVPAITITLAAQVVCLLAGWSADPGETPAATGCSSAVPRSLTARMGDTARGTQTFTPACADGRSAPAAPVRWSWRCHCSPLAVAAASRQPAHLRRAGTGHVVLLYLLVLVFGAVTANL